MSLIFNTKTYVADSFEKDSVGYNGPAKTVTLKDDVKLSRVAAVGSAVFSGQAKAEAKLTRTLTLTGAKTLTGDIIIKVLVFTPVGAASGDIDAALNDTGALVSGADFKSFVKVPKINF